MKMSTPSTIHFTPRLVTWLGATVKYFDFATTQQAHSLKKTSYQRRSDAETTSYQRRCDVASTSIRRYFDVMCLLGTKSACLVLLLKILHIGQNVQNMILVWMPVSPDSLGGLNGLDTVHEMWSSNRWKCRVKQHT